MKQTEHRGWIWARCALALFLALLFLGIALPDMGRVVIDHSTTPPTTHVVGQLRDSLIAVGVTAVPLTLILVGTFRRSQLATSGWILLGVLVAIAFMKGV